MRSWLGRFIRWSRDVEWAMVASVTGGIIVLIPDFIDLLQGELNRIEDLGKSWPLLVMTIIGWMIRQNVWSHRSASDLMMKKVTPEQPLAVEKRLYP